MVVSGQTLQKQTDLLTTDNTEDSSNKAGRSEAMEHKQSVSGSLEAAARGLTLQF